MKKNTMLKGLSVMVLAMGVATVFTATNVFAVHDNNTFELEGNALQDAYPPPPDDWETLYAGGGSATVFTFTVDKNGTDDIFTGGGSKTPNLIEDWQWKSSPPPPDKDNITHAYAANYLVGGEQVIYFGADLFADNGDAELAFWFFQNDISKTATGFDGEHKDEDAYVAVKFSNGGTQANITVYEWWSACDKQDIPNGNSPLVAGDCAADNIRVVIAETTALCGAAAGDTACAITNTSPQSSPWPYTPKSGSENIFPTTTFFEGGINIYEVFGENKCFSSFMATTGASTSFTATAKDFVLGDFNVCSVDVTKTCVNDIEADDIPTAITYNVRGCGINDGGGSILLSEFGNSINGGAYYLPSDLAWYTPGQVDAGSGLRDFNPFTDCNDEGLLLQAINNGSLASSLNLSGGEALIYQFSEVTASNGPTDTVNLVAESGGTDAAEIDPATATANCPPRIFAASLSVTKQCEVALEDAGDNLVVKINVGGQVCNTGEVQLTGLTLVDDPDMPTGVTVVLNPASTTLEPAGHTGECTSYTGYYYPKSIPDGDLCPFSDQVTATANAPVNSAGDGCTEQSDKTSVCTADSNTATCELRIGDGDDDCSSGLEKPEL